MSALETIRVVCYPTHLIREADHISRFCLNPVLLASDGSQLTDEGNTQSILLFEWDFTYQIEYRTSQNNFLVVRSPHIFQKLSRDCASLLTLVGKSIPG